MLDFLTQEHDKLHEKGSFEGIGPGCRFVLAISYMREYRGMRQMAFDYDVSASTVCDSVKWFEEMILKSPDFQLEDIKTEIQKLEETGIEVKTVIIDVEEQPIERPTINQEESYSGKKKRHTTKSQIVIEKETEKIINFYNALGTVHDKKMLEKSNILSILEEKKIGIEVDKGYQGIQELLTNVKIPFKKPKNGELTEEQKEYNQQLAKERIAIEHVNRELKIFRIMKETYRNHQNRYEQKLQIVCCINNLNKS